MRDSLDPLMSHQRADWETPPDLFRLLDDEFHFTLDAAANESNHLCPRWYGPGGIESDATQMLWDGVVWCNPPYGPAIPKFVDMAIESAERKIARLVVMLLPARTDTKWFHKIVAKGYCSSFRFIKGRLKFCLGGQPILDKDGRPVGAPFPSLLVIIGSQVWTSDKIITPLWSEL